MKTLGWVVLIVAVVLFALSRDYGVNVSKTVSVSELNVLDEIRKEPKVVEAIITDAKVLYVSVLDDGTKRDGLASYFCETLREQHADVSRVKVVKAGSTKDRRRDNAYGILLGESWCK